jgi:hypothetical protein
MSHRALILAAMTNGPTRIRDILVSADVYATAGALRAMGVDVRCDPAAHTITLAPPAAARRPLRAGVTEVLVDGRDDAPATLLLAHGAQRDWLVTGDSLFPGGPGSTQGDVVRHARLMDGLERRVFDRLADSTVVLPGHGLDTVLSAEKPRLGEWVDRGW